MGKSSPAAPPAPDYAGAAKQTAAGDLEAARAQTAANRVNQVTPYGSLTYTQQPGYGPDGGWTATQSLSADQQQLLDQQNKTSLGLSQLADRGLGYVDQALGNGITEAGLPKITATNAAQSGEAAMMARFQPQIEQSRKALEAQLANQGITLGSEAYNNAMRTQSQAENDLRTQAVLKGIDVGNTEQNQQMALQNQQLSLKTALQNQPINILNAVRSGSQVTNPTFTSVPQQAQTSGPNMLGAATAQNGYNMGLYNSQVGQNNATTGAIGSLAGAGIGLFSDIRLKTNIKRIGTHHTGIGIYSYIKFGKPEIGVLAQELETVMPHAVATHSSGFKMIDVGAL